MKVHNKMGPGFQEVIYQRCLAIELGRARLSFVREQEQTVYYEGIGVGRRRADVENSENWIRRNEILKTAQVIYEQR